VIERLSRTVPEGKCRYLRAMQDKRLSMVANVGPGAGFGRGRSALVRRVERGLAARGGLHRALMNDRAGDLS